MIIFGAKKWNGKPNFLLAIWAGCMVRQGILTEGEGSVRLTTFS